MLLLLFSFFFVSSAMSGVLNNQPPCMVSFSSRREIDFVPFCSIDYARREETCKLLRPLMKI